MMQISVTKTTAPKARPVPGQKLPFGAVFTDHMFTMDYDEGQGWHDPQIIPYGPISIDPAAKCLHYGQEVFEGLKAYRADDGRILMFRPIENIRRMNLSNERLCMPMIDEELYLEAMKQLVLLDKEWIPTDKDASLYIRPFIIGTEGKLGVHHSKSYKFIIMLSPSGAYYAAGLKPVDILVETQYVRSVRGGLGEAKTGGNYAAGLRAQWEAEEKGCAQVLWLDGVERKFIEEVGAMNIFFVIDGKAITPVTAGTILRGVTRKSVMDLLKLEGVPVEERKISIDEVEEAYKNGKLDEVFGTGTAAVISPVGKLIWKNEAIIPGNGGIGKVSQKLYDDLTGIQWGRKQGPKDWVLEIGKA